jgi:methionine-gamma-lyase
MKNKNLRFNTKLVHAGHFADEFGSATVPIYQTSTFAFQNAKHGAELFAGKDKGYIYTRIGNPTIGAFEQNIAELENGFGGIATSSGMGAVSTIYMALLEKDSHFLSTSSVYGPSRGIMENYFGKLGIRSSFVDTSDVRNIEAAITPGTKILFIETPSNPTIQITDLEACAKIAHADGAVLVVDNTFSSPVLQNPLDLGADVVFHSVTKFINGHADIVGGIIVTKTEELYKKIRPVMVGMGCNMDPHQAYLALRGVKTMGIRVERAQESAMKIAEWLEKHPKIEWIRYPGLKSHPQYDLAKKQMKGPGAMFSFEVKGGLSAGITLMNSVQVATLAVSLGGVETLIQHPASMTHSGMSPENRLKSGITDGLVRYSVGIEDVNDLLEDLEQALAKI